MGELGGKNWYCLTPAIRLHGATWKKILHVWRSVYLHLIFFQLFFYFFFCRFRQKWIKMKKILKLDHILKSNISSQIYRLFYLHLYKGTIYKDLLTKDLLTSEFFFKLCISQGYIQNTERNWRNQFA